MSDPSPFVHLHVHSMYSLSDALGNVNDIVERAKELGFDAIALTDHGGLYGAVEFFEVAKKRGIKPIFGVEAFLAPHKHTDRRPGIDSRAYHLTLLAETYEGYKNLLRLVSLSYVEGFYYKPRMDKDLLRQYGKGLIALSGCLKGDVPQACHANDLKRAEELVREYQEIFGEQNFFLELVHHPESPTQTEVNERLIGLSETTGAPIVATKDVHYLHPDDREAQDVLVCIHEGKLLDERNRQSMSTLDLSMNSAEEMVKAFSDHSEAIAATRTIADRCQVEFEIGKFLLPKFDVPLGETDTSYLLKLCMRGLDERYPDPTLREEARVRMEFELSTITRMGYDAYFLIVQDYIVWAKNHGVIVGPGRGSAAGSVVAYVLKITNLDPLRYGLLFERFLNPDRISMPDIDTDFDDVKRKDVIEYVMKKYGNDHVAGIITFGTMAARAAVRDVGRVLGMPYAEVDHIAKSVPPPVQGKHIPLKKSIKDAPELRALYESDPRVKRLLDLAIRLEGTTRHASQHACGIVITPQPLVEYAPLQKAQGGDVTHVIQYSLHSAEEMGLLKMDFLGLSNLSVIRDCLEIVQAVHGAEINIDTIPLDDPLTFTLLGRGETTGVFQLESEGMKKYIRELKPTVIEDIIAMVALYRPGPLGSGLVESFILRKHGKEKVAYMHPLAENALKNTYGIPVYQEQVMQVAKDLAGFTGGEADTLRKAMGKKIARLMVEMRAKFVMGSVGNGVKREIAEAIFTQFEEFAAYGFNKSHAACYALIAYQTAYLKAHYPDAFMAALLNSDCTNLDRVTIEVEECRRMGMEVLAPDINESFAKFSVVRGTNKLRFGLLTIKGLGDDVVEVMIKERKTNGPYKDLADFLSRINHHAFNRRSLEVLIRSGALDRFGERNALNINIEGLLDFHRRLSQEASSGQVNLFSLQLTGDSLRVPTLPLKPAPEATSREKLMWEKELLGLYVSAHPFREYSDRLPGLLTPILELKDRKREKSVRIGGIIGSAKKIYTKNNEPMVFLKLEDLGGDVEVVVFPRVYRDKPELWEADRLVVVAGRVQEKDGELKFLAESGYELTPDNIDEVAKYITHTTLESDPKLTAQSLQLTATQQAITIHLRAQLPESLLQKLKEIFNRHPGYYRVYFVMENEQGKQKILSNDRIAFNDLIVKEIEQILGQGTVKVEV
ncbi:MAG: DNA polymerase III subunit alpha [Candidatus Uhrbacteria bacterium]|nr:DNA polymerase III subunit alpha [Candidatus Uhrbacteria bacterium]